jgi:hypothetical protein
MNFPNSCFASQLHQPLLLRLWAGASHLHQPLLLRPWAVANHQHPQLLLLRPWYVANIRHQQLLLRPWAEANHQHNTAPAHTAKRHFVAGNSGNSPLIFFSKNLNCLKNQSYRLLIYISVSFKIVFLSSSIWII